MDLLFERFPVKLASSSADAGLLAGRSVVTRRAVAAGELLLRSACAGATVHTKHERFFCENCFGYSLKHQLPELCSGCNTVSYCSSGCQMADESRHTPHCGLLASAKVNPPLALGAAR